MTLIHWYWHFIPRWPLRSIFSRFPDQLLKDLVFWGSPGDYSTIDPFLGDAFGVLPCPFKSTVHQCGARLPIHTLNNWTLLSMMLFFKLGLCLSVTLLLVDLWQYYACCIRSGVTRSTFFMVLYLCRMCQCGLHVVFWSHIGILIRLAVRQNLYSSLSVPAYRFCWPCILWCGTGGF